MMGYILNVVSQLRPPTNNFLQSTNQIQHLDRVVLITFSLGLVSSMRQVNSKNIIVKRTNENKALLHSYITFDSM